MEFKQALDPIRSLDVAWKLFKQTPVTVLIGGLLIGFLESGGGGGRDEDAGSDSNSVVESTGTDDVFGDLAPWAFLLIPICFCLLLGFFALASWLEVGFARAVQFSLRTGRDEVSRVFKGGNRLWAMMLARFYCALLAVLCFLPALGAVIADTRPEGDWSWVQILTGLASFVLFVYVWLGLILVNPIVAFEGCTPSEALGRSWRMAERRRWTLLWFTFVQLLVTIGGLLACCIGLFVTVPLAQVMRFECYVALTMGDEYPYWWIGSGRISSDEHKSGDFSSPQAPPPLPPQG